MSGLTVCPSCSRKTDRRRTSVFLIILSFSLSSLTSSLEHRYTTEPRVFIFPQTDLQ